MNISVCRAKLAHGCDSCQLSIPEELIKCVKASKQQQEFLCHTQTKTCYIKTHFQCLCCNGKL